MTARTISRTAKAATPNNKTTLMGCETIAIDLVTLTYNFVLVYIWIKRVVCIMHHASWQFWSYKILCPKKKRKSRKICGVQKLLQKKLGLKILSPTKMCKTQSSLSYHGWTKILIFEIFKKGNLGPYEYLRLSKNIQ